MIVRTVLIASLFFALPCLARAQAENPFQWFARMDANKDGKLSYQEVPSPLFAQIDQDGDGYVTLDEFKAYLLEEALKELDTNGDGWISQAEFEVLYFDTERYFRDRQSLAQPAGGGPPPDSLRGLPTPPGFRFAQDFFAGTRDASGLFLQGTETTALVAHRGRLYASFGGNTRDLAHDTLYHGYAIARKDAAEQPWRVDLDIGRTPFRISTMASVRFTTDAQGSPLSPPGEVIVAGHWAGSRSLLIRNDGNERWEQHAIPTSDTARPGEGFTIRSFGGHVDKVTGIHLLFAGTHTSLQTRYGQYPSAIYRASYDPGIAGGLRWHPEAELRGVGRIMAFAECNGDLYAACGILDSGATSGGVFRRRDGTNPSWDLVYRWKEYDLRNYDDESRIMRGLTAVPHPRNAGREMLIAFRYYPEPLIERIDPDDGHRASVELRLAEFIGNAWHGGGRYSGPIRCAYNGFRAITDPLTGETVHVTGLQAYHPLFPAQPYNGSYYLVRRTDASYRWGAVYDSLHPVSAERRSLDATRCICPSPFTGEESRVCYFGGYDGAFIDNRSAWIYKATLAGASTGIASVLPAGAALSVHPNPALEYFAVSGDSGAVVVRDLLGREVWRGRIDGSAVINAARWAQGVYLLIHENGAIPLIKR